ncbi:t9ss c-terminal target domain-containing protein [Gigaspora margarita]|uniref:T9ss c-terminal target domain-containing protein n=1 Tax=Gigaspora margarita TaxID=4874 RepID=A0A8H3X689_GIGMA|nr:t9ss c-terminal target domain-containing protein [Gigaspora margarita]
MVKVTAIKNVETNFGHGLLIDIHGHAHPEHLIEIGYVLPDETLSLPTPQINENPDIYSGSSIRSLYTRKSNNIQFADLLYGQTTSFGGRLQSHGYATVPSHIHKYLFKDTKYFHGGYCVQKLPRILRVGNKEKRSTFILALSECIAWFLKEYYG